MEPPTAVLIEAAFDPSQTVAPVNPVHGLGRMVTFQVLILVSLPSMDPSPLPGLGSLCARGTGILDVDGS